ncbi:MAG: DUF6786 family protein [Phycisphaeraceae bacterium]
MADWLDPLRDAIEGCDHATHTWEAGDGRLLLTDHAARVLGCELPGVEDNIFWHDPALTHADTAGPLLAKGGPFGGDRFWIAPEVGFIWTDLEAARIDPISSAELPAAMDPGEWGVIEQDQGRLVWAATMALQDHRSDKRITLNVSREVLELGPPTDLPADVRQLGFAVRHDLSLVEGDEQAVAGGWQLLQIPPGGTLVCPTVGPVDQPRAYFDPLGPENVRVDDRAVRFFIGGPGRVKMGLRPDQTAGRMGYYRRVNATMSTLIARSFLPQPGEVYVDLPRESEDLVGGDTLQAYSDDGTYGGFGEMEHHEPAIVVGEGPSLRSGTSVTHVFAGPDEAIRDLTRTFVGEPVD